MCGKGPAILPVLQPHRERHACLQAAGAERELDPPIEQAQQLAVGVVDAGADLGERVGGGVIGWWWHDAATVLKAAHRYQGPHSGHARWLYNKKY